MAIKLFGKELDKIFDNKPVNENHIRDYIATVNDLHNALQAMQRAHVLNEKTAQHIDSKDASYQNYLRILQTLHLDLEGLKLDLDPGDYFKIQKILSELMHNFAKSPDLIVMLLTILKRYLDKN
jgi:hypothetical protein